MDGWCCTAETTEASIRIALSSSSSSSYFFFFPISSSDYSSTSTRGSTNMRASNKSRSDTGLVWIPSLSVQQLLDCEILLYAAVATTVCYLCVQCTAWPSRATILLMTMVYSSACLHVLRRHRCQQGLWRRQPFAGLSVHREDWSGAVDCLPL